MTTKNTAITYKELGRMGRMLDAIEHAGGSAPMRQVRDAAGFNGATIQPVRELAVRLGLITLHTDHYGRVFATLSPGAEDKFRSLVHGDPVPRGEFGGTKHSRATLMRWAGELAIAGWTFTPPKSSEDT